MAHFVLECSECGTTHEPDMATLACRGCGSPLLVSYRETGGGAPSSPRRDWRTGLDEAERRLFDALRRWRNERAQREGRPAYVLLTNRQLAALAERRPTDLAGLREIEGIGEAKLRDLGEEILAILHPPPAAGVEGA